MATLEDVIGALTLVQQELVESRVEITALKGQVERLQRNPFDVYAGRGPPGLGGSSQVPPQVTVSIPTPIPLAAPERYSGDPNKVQIFLTQIVLHFSCRPTVFPTNQARVAFTISYLTGDAAAWVVPLVSGNDPLLTDWEAFRKEFERVFDRRATTLCADRELLELRQGKSDLVTYLTKFNRLVAETSWPEGKRLALYYQGLRDELKDVLAQIDPQPTTCTELINLTLRLDHRMAERSGQRNKGDKVFSQSEKGKGSEGGIEAMEIGLVHSSLSRVERELRRRNGLCMYCGKKGHFVRECMAKPKGRDTLGRFTKSASVPEKTMGN